MENRKSRIKEDAEIGANDEFVTNLIDVRVRWNAGIDDGRR